METSLMSFTPRELRRLAVLERIASGDLSQISAAGVLRLSTRQVKRMVRRFRELGPRSVASCRRGRPSNRATDPQLLSCALDLVRRHYPDFGPTFTAEKLVEFHGLRLDHETLRRAMIRAGIWQPHARKTRKLHLPRERRDCVGELVQLDGSHHAWFESRGLRCTLLVAIDDATSTLLGLRFTPTENALGYFGLFAEYLSRWGRPVSVYVDRFSVFKATVESADGEKPQFARALDELDIELICANSPQAKGRVERVNATLQDRLVKELRLRNINTIEDANRFLPTYLETHNQRFARSPRSDFNAHRPLEPQHDLARILSIRHRRIISAKGIVSYENRQFAIDHSLFRQLSSRVVEVRVNHHGKLIIEQGQQYLRCAELPKTDHRHPRVVERVEPANRRVPNPKKAHTPPPNHPWRTPQRSPSPDPARGHL